MKVYTKTGDAGKTSLLGGSKVSKTDPRIEAYGTVDELNSFVGTCRSAEGMSNKVNQELVLIQKHLFELGSELSVDPENPPSFSFDVVEEVDVEYLEKAIDRMDESLAELKNFILPGGKAAASAAHVCRTVCRRAERRTAELFVHGQTRPVVLRYLNRLSDYFFVLARYINHNAGEEETIWSARK